ncbi:MAG: hypothetical protein ACJ763_11350 [Bdellovibrionia bacterium]
MRAPTIALAVEMKNGTPVLLETISDSHEIQLLEQSVQLGETDPLGRVRTHREKQKLEDNEFSDYVEDLLSKPFLKAEIQKYGVQWLKSRIRIEQFQEDEKEAAKVIAEYAFKIFAEETALRDFFLSGPKAQVRVRVIIVQNDLGTAAKIA